MSAAHLACIDPLTTLLRDTLAALEAGRAPDLEAFDAALESRFSALTALGPVDPDGPLAERCRHRLQELDALRRRLEAALGEVHHETRKRLGRITNGRRSIGAYRSSLEGGRRGTRRGQG